MAKAKLLQELFQEIGIERPRDQKTIKAQILDYLDQTCGSREQAVNLKPKGLSNLLDRFLDTGPGRHHFPRDKDSDEWVHFCGRDEVMETLTQIVLKWLRTLKRKSEDNKPTSDQRVKQKRTVPEATTPPNRMSLIEQTAEPAIKDHEDNLEELLDISEILARPSQHRRRDPEDVTVGPDLAADDAHSSDQYTHPSVHASASKAAPLKSRVDSAPSTTTIMPGPSGTKRKRHETIMEAEDRGEETEDETDEESYHSPEPTDIASKRPRLDEDMAPGRIPARSTEAGWLPQPPMPESSQPTSIPAPTPNSPAQPEHQNPIIYRIDIPANFLRRSPREERTSFWPDLITHMLRQRRRAARSRLNEDAAELDQGDVHALNAVDRVLQRIHDEFEAIAALVEGQHDILNTLSSPDRAV